MLENLPFLIQFLLWSWEGRGLLFFGVILLFIIGYFFSKLFEEDEEEPKKNSWVNILLLVVSIILSIAIVGIFLKIWKDIDKGKKLIDSGLENNEPGVYNEVIRQLIGVIVGKDNIEFKRVNEDNEEGTDKEEGEDTDKK